MRLMLRVGTGLRALVLAGAALAGSAFLVDAPVVPAARAQAVATEELLSAVVRIKTFINPDGRTVETLGRQREGNGVVIGGDGLIVTIGYLIVEAQGAEITTNDGTTVAADVVGYDYDTGFGLIRAARALKVRPMPLGKSADVASGEKVLVAGGGGIAAVGPAQVAAKREFAGNWEYLLDEAIFTTPAFPWWSGAALVSKDGKLVGIGSLAVNDARNGAREPSNMFVPIDRLPPIMGELIGDGRVSGPAKPWLGINTNDSNGKLVVQRVTRGGPAEKAGVKTGDTVLGIAGERALSLAELYRRIWAQGTAGTRVKLDLLRNGERVTVDVQSVDRMDHLKLGSSL